MLAALGLLLPAGMAVAAESAPTGLLFSSERPAGTYLASCGSRYGSGDIACVCGWFEDLSGEGVLIDGLPAGRPVTASRNMLCFHLLQAGSHRISGDPARFSRIEEHEVFRIVRSPLPTLVGTMSVPVTWTVAGTSKPVWLDLRNLTPWLADLAGGNQQRALTSGGAVNVVTRVLTTHGTPGSVRLRAWVADGPDAPASRESSRPGEEPSSPGDLARRALGEQMFQLGLKAAAARFEAAVRELPTSGGEQLYRREDVSRLLETTRDDLLRSLPAPELAAFRDSVEDFFDEALQGLPIRTARSGGPGIRLAAFQTGASAQVERSNVEQIFAKIRKLFALGEGPVMRRLCVRSTPDQATARLYPRSFPSDYKITSTVSIVTLAIGKYKYEVSKDGFKTIAYPVDLVWDPQPVLDCSLVRARKAGDATPCRLLPAAKECPW
jgi:hypothetical protein